ncbi:TIGR02147 family protein [Bdellovibrio sp. HCB117]|uniref:TIGR02147 family protein n=1 Tax=Bdellovibrio sp. HCB117 TaxID=3394359 RepID=UPI0039B405BE
MKYREVADLITKVLEERRFRNPQYSMRALARDLGVSPSRVSNIMRGKVLPGKRVIQRIEVALKLNKNEAAYLAYLVQKSKHRKKDTRRAHQLQESEIFFIREWYHFAILNAMDTLHFDSDPEVVAERLNLSPELVKDSYAKLLQAGLIHETPQGLRPTYTNLTSTSDIPSEALKNMHHQLIDKARESLIRDPIDVRDITSIVIPSNPKNIYKVKMLAREFRRQANEILEQGEKTEVYSICMQIYPLTHSRNH